MSTFSKHAEDQKHEEAGKLIAARLREAREKKGKVICPVCHINFDATYLLKCPRCRTFISKLFRETRFRKNAKPKVRSRPQKKSGKTAIHQPCEKPPLQLSLFP